MKKKMQSILSLVSAVLMLMPVFPLSASATTYSGTCGAEGDNVTWEIDVNTGTLLINGTGDMADYEDWFATPWYDYKDFPGFTNVVVGEGVTSVGDNAFRITNATKIILSSTVKHLGIRFFPDYSQKNIIIDANNPHLKIDDYGVIYSKDGKTLVYATSDMYVYIVPDGVEEFALYSFCYSSVSAFLYIPASTKNIPVEAFFSKDIYGSHPNRIPRFVVSENNLYYSSDKYGVLFDKNKEILYMAPSVPEQPKYFIPDSVKEIADYAFYHYSPNNVLIAGNVEKIDSYAFCPYLGPHGTNYTCRLYVPKNVTSLADDFFVNEELLTEYAGEIFAVVYYEGTQEEWESVYKGNKDWLTVYYEHEHTNTIVEETCTQKIYTCSGCKTTNFIEDIGDNHDWELIGYNNGAPCIGFTKGYYCTKCREEKEEHETPTEEHHFYGDEYDYLCCVGGNANLRCKYCEMDYDVYVEAEGHLYEYVSDNNATCTEDGTKHEECSRCSYKGETVVDVGSKLGHDLTEITVLSQQTCTQDGISVQSCKRCAEIVATIEGAYGHFDNDGDGKCDECKVVLEVIFPNVPSVPGTDVTPDAPGHTHSFTREVIFAPDCVTAGEQEFTCSCGEIYRAVIPANGHTDENADGVCDVCDESLGEKMGDSEVSGFLAKILEFFNKIAEFFRKLFNMA